MTPRLTITLSDAEAASIVALADEQGREPSEVAGDLVSSGLFVAAHSGRLDVAGLARCGSSGRWYRAPADRDVFSCPHCDDPLIVTTWTEKTP